MEIVCVCPACRQITLTEEARYRETPCGVCGDRGLIPLDTEARKWDGLSRKERVRLVEEALESGAEERLEKKRAENEALRAEIRRIRDFPVTTVDLKQPYRVIGPVSVNTSNKGIFSSAYQKLVQHYEQDPYLRELVVRPRTESVRGGEGGLLLFSLLLSDTSAFEGRVGQSEFDRAYYICVAELKRRAAELGGDAVVGMRMDYDLDTSNFGAFYLQMYGTAVKLEET